MARISHIKDTSGTPHTIPTQVIEGRLYNETTLGSQLLIPNDVVFEDGINYIIHVNTSSLSSSDSNFHIYYQLVDKEYVSSSYIYYNFISGLTYESGGEFFGVKQYFYQFNGGSRKDTVEIDGVTWWGSDYLTTFPSTKTLDEKIDSIVDKIYPVGSIYMSLTDSTVSAVQNRFGGTWAKIEGRFLLAASSSYAVNTTGGSADAIVVSHTHELAGTNAKAVDVSGHTHGHAGTNAGAVSNGGHTHTEYAGINEASSGLFTSITSTRSYPNTHIIGGAGTTSSNGAHTHSLTGNTTSAGGHGHSLTGNTKSSGNSGTGKNMPPYLAVYMYKRTA